MVHKPVFPAPHYSAPITQKRTICDRGSIYKPVFPVPVVPHPIAPPHHTSHLAAKDLIIMLGHNVGGEDAQQIHGEQRERSPIDAAIYWHA